MTVAHKIHELFIVPPSGSEYEDAALHGRIRADLSERFPQYRYTIRLSVDRQHGCYSMYVGDPELGTPYVADQDLKNFQDIGAHLYKHFLFIRTFH
ncbi:hypothetical protein RB623_27765 [Mesorhizobium sp. LHD-90]|uniref:hypothetical protein n=1 Tax=Mesorhizobium sp. LHD-90 TaxID=3071414 RepID=UPI0027DF17E0|nr:hypothetical protein [Mesorhizobium sp. LHD-90]MDQ6437869.1 hypothetical protein [Mesorhizobium sp. LHD-90]